mgnify:FL=1
MLPHKHPILKIFIAIACFFTGIYLLTRYQNPKAYPNSVSTLATGVLVSASASPAAEIQAHAPDGTANLIQRTKISADQSKTYSFFAADVDGKNQQQIFTRTVSPVASMSIPFNAWAPDNKTVFLEENDGVAKKYLVVKVSGERFSKNEQFLEVAGLWGEKKMDYVLDTVTGWASPTLLILTTKKEDGSKGPNYWFEIPSRSFLILAS